MKHNKIHLLTFPLLAVYVVMIFSLSIPVKTPIAQGAFGISPPWFRNNHVLPGTTFEQIITLTTNNPTEDMLVKTSITGDKKIRKWVTIKNQKNLIMKKGQTQFPMEVIAKIPKRAGIKEYVGNIEIRLEPLKKSNSGGVAIALGANAEIRLKVIGNKVIDYKVSSARVEQTEKGGPIAVELNVENLGNTDLANLEVKVEIWNQSEQKLITTLNSNKLSRILDPYETGKVLVMMRNPNLQTGDYWARVKVFKGKTAIFETKIFLQVEAKPKPIKLPSVPKINSEVTGESTGKVITPKAVATITSQAEAVHPSAPEARANNLLMILVIISIAFGAISLIAVLTMMFIFIKRQGANVNTIQTNKPESTITYDSPTSANDPLK